MTELSPAAQAVLDAYNKLSLNSRQWHDGVGPQIKLADALRAVAERSSYLLGDFCHPKYMEGVEATADFLEHIATELENYD